MHQISSGLLRAFAATMLALAALPVFAADPAPVPADRLLPGDVYGYLSIPDIPAFRRAWEDSLYGELTRDPSLADFREELLGRVKKLSQELEQQVGVDLETLLQLPAGQLSAAFVRLPKDAETGKREFAGVLLADFSEDSEDTIDTLLDKAMEALEKNGAVRSTKEVDGTRIVIYASKQPNGDGDNAAGEGKVTEQFAWFVRDTRFVLSSSPAALEAMLARWDGKHEQTFAANDVYSYIMQRCRTYEAGGTSIVEWYANPFGLLQAGLQAGGQQAQQFALVGNFLPILGVTKMKAIGGTMVIGGDDQVAASRTLIYVQKPVTGLLNLFHWPATKQAPPAWVNASAETYTAINWDFPGAYRAVSSLVNSFYGEGFLERQLDDFATSPGGPGIHPKKDFLDNLTGGINYFSVAPPADNPEEMAAVLGLGTADEKKMNSVLQSIAAVPGLDLGTREFMGHTIYEFETELPGGGTKINITVAHGHLLFSSKPELLDQVLSGNDTTRPLEQIALWKRIASRFPDKTSLISFSWQNARIRALYGMLRSGQLDEADDAGVDFSKLPEFDAVSKYLPASASYVVPDEHGTLMINFSVLARPHHN